MPFPQLMGLLLIFFNIFFSEKNNTKEDASLKSLLLAVLPCYFGGSNGTHSQPALYLSKVT